MSYRLARPGRAGRTAARVSDRCPGGSPSALAASRASLLILAARSRRPSAFLPDPCAALGSFTAAWPRGPCRCDGPHGRCRPSGEATAPQADKAIPPRPARQGQRQGQRPCRARADCRLPHPAGRPPTGHLRGGNLAGRPSGSSCRLTPVALAGQGVLRETCHARRRSRHELLADGTRPVSADRSRPPRGSASIRTRSAARIACSARPARRRSRASRCTGRSPIDPGTWSGSPRRSGGCW